MRWVRWVKRFVRWITVEAWWPLWSIVLPPAGLWLLVCWLCADPVVGLRYAGWVLQIGGLTVVGWRLGKTLKDLGRSGVFCPWLKSLQRKPMIVPGVPSRSKAPATPGWVRTGPADDASAEARLDQLKKEVEELGQSVRRVEAKVRSERSARKEAIEEARADSQSRQDRVESALFGDYHWELSGLWWLGFGMTFATIPEVLVWL